MIRLGIGALWLYRKEAISLIYLFLIGMIFGAIWLFHEHKNSKILLVGDVSTNDRPTKTTVQAYEEDHKIVEVVIDDANGLIKERHMATLKKAILKYPEKIAKIVPDVKEELWRTNSVQVASFVDNKPQITIVIDDLGIVKDRTLEIINFEAPLTLSFLPYAKDLPRLTRLAAGKGHELMIHIPMEPKGDNDPGPHALLTHDTNRQILANLDFNLSRFEGYVGINNHMGSAFTEDRNGVNQFLNDIQERGLLVLDSKTTEGSVLAKMATQRNIPNVTRDIFLDNEQNLKYILIQLKKLEDMARRKGHAIAIGHPYAETIEALSVWLPTLQRKGIVIVPLSHLVKEKYPKILQASDHQTIQAARMTDSLSAH